MGTLALSSLVHSLPLLVALFVVAVTALLLRARRAAVPRRVVLPGPGDDAACRTLFRAEREDVFLTALAAHAPVSRTCSWGSLPATADPGVARALLLSREHSLGRSVVYRLIAWVMPSSDGILFSGGAAWRARHSLFTSLFAAPCVRGLTCAAFEGAVRTASAHAVVGAGVVPPLPAQPAHHYSDAQSLWASLAPAAEGDAAPGADTGTRADLLTLVRWGAMRTFFAWAAGADLDDARTGGSALLRRTARALDAYSRVCFEVLPVHERTGGWLGAARWLRDYTTLWRVAGVLHECLVGLAALHPPVEAAKGARGGGEGVAASGGGGVGGSGEASGGGSSAGAQPALSSSSSLQPLLFQDRSNATVRALAASAAPPVGPPRPLDTFLSRMLGAGWARGAVTSEVNHLHGAHKAVAFIATAALVELASAHPRVRAALRNELVAVCGEPPRGATPAELCAHARRVAGAGDVPPAPAATPWRLPCKGDLDAGALPLLACVWRETLRRHVVSMGVLRRLGADGEPLELPGEGRAQLLRGGDEVCVLLHALHHDSALWGPDAHSWEPARWDPSSDYWARRRAWEGAAGAGDAPEGPSGGSRYASHSGSGGGRFFVPATRGDAFTPFLDGMRRCAGSVLAELEFAVLLFAYCVPFTVDVALPTVPPAGAPAIAALTGVGGGVAVVPGAVCVARAGALAVIREPALPFSTPSRLDAAAAHPATTRLRIHLVKRADMFTTLDGDVPYVLTRAV